MGSLEFNEGASVGAAVVGMLVDSLGYDEGGTDVSGTVGASVVGMLVGSLRYDEGGTDAPDTVGSELGTERNGVIGSKETSE